MRIDKTCRNFNSRPLGCEGTQQLLITFVSRVVFYHQSNILLVFVGLLQNKKAQNIDMEKKISSFRLEGGCDASNLLDAATRLNIFYVKILTGIKFIGE